MWLGKLYKQKLKKEQIVALQNSALEILWNEILNISLCSCHVELGECLRCLS